MLDAVKYVYPPVGSLPSRVTDHATHDSGEQNPSDLHEICGSASSRVKSRISDVCGAHTEAALNAFAAVCRTVLQYSCKRKFLSFFRFFSQSSHRMLTRHTAAPSMTSSMGNPAVSTESANMNSSTAMTGSESMTTSMATSTENRMGGTITFTSTYWDDDCTCTKTMEHTTATPAGPIGMATSAATAPANVGAAPAANNNSLASAPANGGSPESMPTAGRNGAAPYPTSGAGGDSTPGCSGGSGSAMASGCPAGEAGAAAPSDAQGAPGSGGSPAAGTAPMGSGAPYGTAGMPASSTAGAGVSNVGQYTGAAPGRTLTESLTGVAVAVAGLALLL